MTNAFQKYSEYLNQQFVDPSNALSLEDDKLMWFDIDLLALAHQYAEPAFVTYLPAIRKRTELARTWVRDAINEITPGTQHQYYVSIKANYWPWAIQAAMQGSQGIEISSINDLSLIISLVDKGFLDKGIGLIVNGVKSVAFRKALLAARRAGLVNPWIFADSAEEVEWYATHLQEPLAIGLRKKPSNNKPGQFESRFGVHSQHIEPLMDEVVAKSELVSVNAIHIQSYGTAPEGGFTFEDYTEGISRFVELKAKYPTIEYLNIGGGLFNSSYPPKKVNDTNAEFINWIVDYLFWQCKDADTSVPTIITELGSYNYAPATVWLTRSEARKPAFTNSEWLFVEGSIMNDLPDALLLKHHPFVPLALSHLDANASRYRLAGLTCDPMDWMDSGELGGVTLPDVNEPLTLGFFNCGAYQSTLGGVGGLRHCMLDNPHQLFLDRNTAGELVTVKHIPARQTQEILLEISGLVDEGMT